MSASCEACGAALPVNLLQGLCPRCLAATMFPEPGTDATRRVGDYELLRELGRGGAGVVYLARQVTLDRLVGLKVLIDAGDASPETRTRFQREAHEAARLRHPNIVPIHEVGVHEGTLFYSMDLIEGDDLETRYSRYPISPRDAALLVSRAARAVQHAHDAGVLHRDIKPANILVDETGEPHLTDFGLALAADGRGRLTQAGEVVGSPAYMAPEQLRGDASVACDVYSLGAVLYFLLTRRPPFVATQLGELLAAVERGDPVPPRRLDPALPRDLETISLRALAHDPARRYASAGALADDLERWLGQRPIRARPVSIAERGWHWSRRNRALAVFVGLFACALALGSTAVAWQWRRAEQAAANTALHLYASNLKIASDALLSGDLGTARRTLERCLPDQRDIVWSLLSTQAVGDAELVADGPSWTVTDLAVSPDGALAAAAAQDDLVRVWRLDTGREVCALPGTTSSWWVQFGPGGRTLFTADTAVRQWNLADATMIREFPGRSVVVSPDERVLFSGMGDRFVFSGKPGGVSAWSVADGTKIFDLPVSGRLLALSRDGRQLAVSDAETWIAVFDAHDGRPLIDAWPSLDRVWHLEFSPDGRRLAASGWTREVRIWDLENAASPPHRLRHPLNTWQTRFSPDGNHLAVACSDQAVHLWDTTTWTESRRRRGHENEVWSVAWQPDGRCVAAGRDPRLMRWGPQTPDPPSVRHDEVSTNIAWLPGGRLVTLREDATGGSAAVVTTMNTRAVESRHPAETPLAYDRVKGRLWLWVPGELRSRSLATPTDTITVPWAGGADGSMLGAPRVVTSAGLAWAAMHDGAVEFRHLADGSLAGRVEDVFRGRTYAVGALSPEGRHFVWAGLDMRLFILDRATGRRQQLEGHHYDVAAITFAPGGGTFFTGGHDGLIFEWSTKAPHHRREFGRHRTSVGQIAFSADGRVLVSHDADLGVRIWNRATAREVAFLPEPRTGTSEWSGFSLEEDWLAMRCVDGEIRAWPISIGGRRD